MPPNPSAELESRVLVHAPVGRDGELLEGVLKRGNLPCHICASIGDLCREIDSGAGAVLLAEEALDPVGIQLLTATLKKQRDWSDIPLLIFTIGGGLDADLQKRLACLESLGEVTLLERPLRSDTIIRASRAALQARAKQYELRRRDAELQLINDNVPVLISYIDQHEVFRRVNKTYTDWFGLKPSDIVGRTISDIGGEPHYSIAQPYIRRALAGEAVSFESQVRCAGGVVREVWVSYAPERAADGSTCGFVALVQDISERKTRELELQKTNEELQRLNRELEEFAYVASHDLQEPLRMVRVYAELLTKRFASADPNAQKFANFVQQGVTRMQALIEDLLTFSRTVQNDEEPPGTVELSEALREAEAALERALRESGGKIVVSKPLPRVVGDVRQLALVFQNLLSNALKYRKKDVRPTVLIDVQREEDVWVVSVADNGIGFEEQYAQRIFGLFKRLHKDEYPGTGLGLAICERIVQRYGGRVWATGRVGEGATFYLSLPAAKDEVSMTESNVSAGAQGGGLFPAKSNP